MINQCYEYEAAHTIQDVLSCNGDLNIALVADSHLDNSVPATIENISAVDQAVQFDCCVHLGDFLAGEIGRRYAKLLLRQQLALFRPTVSSGRFFPVQGNHDACSGPYSARLWPEAVGFLDAEQGVCRPAQKPYYYVDIAKEKVRLVFVCSYYYEHRGGGSVMIFGYEEEQIQWLQNEVLVLPADWTVMLFSHDCCSMRKLHSKRTTSSTAIRSFVHWSSAESSTASTRLDGSSATITGIGLRRFSGSHLSLPRHRPHTTRSCLMTTCASGRESWARRAKISGMRSF